VDCRPYALVCGQTEERDGSVALKRTVIESGVPANVVPSVVIPTLTVLGMYRGETRVEQLCCVQPLRAMPQYSWRK
jgi:hypothetical protein